ncbi:MAG: hypothetical protein ACOCQD_03210 [archaeon]
MEFDVWSFDYQNELCDFVHEQTPSDDCGLSLYGMDDKYAHKDKQLKILKETVYDPYLTGKGFYRQNKHGNMTIKIIK